jgi:rubredoxin
MSKEQREAFVAGTWWAWSHGGEDAKAEALRRYPNAPSQPTGGVERIVLRDIHAPAPRCTCNGQDLADDLSCPIHGDTKFQPAPKRWRCKKCGVFLTEDEVDEGPYDNKNNKQYHWTDYGDSTCGPVEEGT